MRLERYRPLGGNINETDKSNLQNSQAHDLDLSVNFQEYIENISLEDNNDSNRQDLRDYMLSRDRVRRETRPLARYAHTHANFIA